MDVAQQQQPSNSITTSTHDYDDVYNDDDNDDNRTLTTSPVPSQPTRPAPVPPPHAPSSRPTESPVRPKQPDLFSMKVDDDGEEDRNREKADSETHPDEQVSDMRKNVLTTSLDCLLCVIDISKASRKHKSTKS